MSTIKLSADNPNLYLAIDVFLRNGSKFYGKKTGTVKFNCVKLLRRFWVSGEPSIAKWAKIAILGSREKNYYSPGFMMGYSV
jgi:hypothetical protein